MLSGIYIKMTELELLFLLILPETINCRQYGGKFSTAHY